MTNLRTCIRDVSIVSVVALVGFGAPVAAQSYSGGIHSDAGVFSSRTKIILVQGDKANRGAGGSENRGGASAGGDRGRGGASAETPARDGGAKGLPPRGDRAGRSNDGRGDGNRAERGSINKARPAEGRGQSSGKSNAAKRVREGKELGSGDRRGGRDRAERGSRWGGFGNRGRRYRPEGRVGFYFWAPWIGGYAYYNDYDSCYAASYRRCLSAGYGKTYCKGYVSDLCAW